MSAAAAPAPDASQDLARFQASVRNQEQLVRRMMSEDASNPKIKEEEEKLGKMRAEAKALAEAAGGVPTWNVNKAAMDDVVKQRMFVVPSFEIHHGVAGLYDLGPAGTSLKNNILSTWRRHFVLEEGMLQIECTALTPHRVLEASGHVEKFVDLMVSDVETGECFRADKLLEDAIDHELTEKADLSAERRAELRHIRSQADAFSPEELGEQLAALGIKSPSTGNALSAPFPFNLMFPTSIGPKGDSPGFLRPETAQGIFVNFSRLLAFNNARMPFAAAQIGLAFRNEIAPRGGLLRVREFLQAEIEHFVDPLDKSHAKFGAVADLRLTLFPEEHQLGDGLTISPTLGEAVSSGMINNETLAYFMARTHLFLLSVGVHAEGLRFRQHLRSEMAHYASDCWDAEVLLSAGWVEIVGHADRACFDLAAHAAATGTSLDARRNFAEPKMVEIVSIEPNNKVLGKTFRRDAPHVKKALLDLSGAEAEAFHARLVADGTADLETEGGVFPVTPEMATLGRVTKRVQSETFTPSVIEPSFGVGRILQCVLEHSFYTRDGDDKRGVFGFPALVAPMKVAVLPLDNRIPKDFVAGLVADLTRGGLSNIQDSSSNSIGRRYARADEIGIPFALTVDHTTVADKAENPKAGTVTIRERDSCAQIRVPCEEVVGLISGLCTGASTWTEAMGNFEVVTTGADKVPAARADAPAAAGAGGGGAAAGGAAPAPAPAAATTTAAVARPTGNAEPSTSLVVEGTDRTCGRFARPEVPIL